MKGGLEARILKLEQSANMGSVCYVARRAADSRLIPAREGAILAPFFAVIPELCGTTEEWVRFYGQPSRDGGAGQ